jgi:tripartite-type tricarboxylate transporter receptor subunit TctC
MRCWKCFLILVAAVALLAAGGAPAQQYPSKPVRVIVPFPPGGGADAIARMFGERMAEGLQQQVLVENRPGGNAVIGAEAVARAPADGYTLLFAIDAIMTLNPHMSAKLPYDPEQDFAPVSLSSRYAMLITANPASRRQLSSFGSLVAYARANPGKLNYGAGSVVAQLASELIKSVTGTDMVYVPFKGSAPAVLALISGDIDWLMSDFNAVLGQVRGGKLKAVATTGGQRSSVLPDTPTIREAGFDRLEITGWNAFFAPAGTPPPVIERLNREINAVVAQPKFVQRFREITASEPAGSTPAELTELRRADLAKWGALIKANNITIVQ